MTTFAITPALIEIALGSLAGLALGFFGWRWYARRQAQRILLQAVTQGAFEHLRNVLVPDGNGGAYHVDFLLLTVRGVVVIDLRDVTGNVFGGDQMNEWTVMNRSLRTTFPNPQSALYDRVAAVKALAGDVPVEGRIVFTRRAAFPKGMPRWTARVDTLGAEFPAVDRGTLEATVRRWLGGWQKTKAATMPSGHGAAQPAGTR
ncbi:MAG: NERD domain-containing protein [Steroidobacteraceae bacterium]